MGGAIVYRASAAVVWAPIEMNSIKLSSLKHYVEVKGAKLHVDVGLSDGTHYGFSV